MSCVYVRLAFPLHGSARSSCVLLPASRVARMIVCVFDTSPSGVSPFFRRAYSTFSPSACLSRPPGFCFLLPGGADMDGLLTKAGSAVSISIVGHQQASCISTVDSSTIFQFFRLDSFTPWVTDSQPVSQRPSTEVFFDIRIVAIDP